MSSFSTSIDKQDPKCFYFIFILVPQYISCMKMKYGCLIKKIYDKRHIAGFELEYTGLINIWTFPNLVFRLRLGWENNLFLFSCSQLVLKTK